MLACINTVTNVENNETRYRILDTADGDKRWINEESYNFLVDELLLDREAIYKFYSFSDNLYMLDYLNMQSIYKDNKLVAEFHYASTKLPSMWYDTKTDVIHTINFENIITFYDINTQEKNRDGFHSIMTKMLTKENKVGMTKFRRYANKTMESGNYNGHTFDNYTGMLRFKDTRGNEIKVKEIWGTEHFAHESTKYREYYVRSGHIVDKDLNPMFLSNSHQIYLIKQPIYQQYMMKEICKLFQRYLPIYITPNDEYCARYILCSDTELRRLTRDFVLEMYLRTVYYRLIYTEDGWYVSFTYMTSNSIHDAYETTKLKLNIDLYQKRG